MAGKVKNKIALYLATNNGKRNRIISVIVAVILLFAILSSTVFPAITASGKILRSVDSVNLVIGAIDTTRNIDQTATPVLRWSAEIENEKNLENLVYVSTLLPDDDSYSMEYVTSYPILLTLYKDDGVLKQSYYYWTSDSVILAEDGLSFSILLPESTYYDAYSVDYYTTYASETDADKTYSLHGAVVQKLDDEYITLTEADGEFSEEIPTPEITASIGSNVDGIIYAAQITVPAGNSGIVFNLGGGITV